MLESLLKRFFEYYLKLIHDKIVLINCNRTLGYAE